MNQSSFQIRQILFPTDFSKSSAAATLHVAGLAHSIGAKVALLNVVPFLSGWHGVSEQYLTVGDDVLRELELSQKANEASRLKDLETLRDQHFQNVECSVCVKAGGVAESVVEYANEIQTDLIMMPTHGYGPPRPYLIGSVTAKVLHDAHCAVWTSPHPTELDAFRMYRQILFAMDYQVLSAEVLTRASELAQLLKSRLSVVTAIPCPAIGSVPCADSQSVQLLKKEISDALGCLLKDHHLDASVHVLEGTIGDVIRQAAAMEDADLVVIGRGHLDEPFGHLRTHAYEIIWNSPCPVLSVV